MAFLARFFHFHQLGTHVLDRALERFLIYLPIVLTPSLSHPNRLDDCVFDRALELLEAKMEEEGKAIYFSVFKKIDLCEDPDSKPSYRAVGEALDLSESQVRTYLHVVRDAFRRSVYCQVAEYVGDAHDIVMEVGAILQRSS